MTFNLTAFLKRLVLCITAPVWIPLASVLLVIAYVLVISAGCFEWLLTGKKTIFEGLDLPFFI